MNAIKKKEMSKKIGLDLWSMGREEFGKSDVLENRAAEEFLRNKKADLRQCISNGIHNDKTGSGITIHPDIDYTPSWQEIVRSQENNLRLDFN